MSRALSVMIVLLCLPATRAEATEQIRERLVVEGRVFRTPVTPLDGKLTPEVMQRLGIQPRASNLWRGYVGTWVLEDDALYLLSLVHYVSARDTPEGPSRRVAKDIPLVPARDI